MSAQLNALCGELFATHQFFSNTIACFDEADSSFQPSPDTYTVAHHVAHVARTVDWFIDAALSPEGFDLNFEMHIAEARAVNSLAAAIVWLNKSFSAAQSRLQAAGDETLAQPLPSGPIMPGMPRSCVVGGIVDHSAHHRGALAVYARLLGKVPAMPYSG